MATVLPQELPVETFFLDPLLIVPTTGGVYLQDTLLSCTTLDASSLESTLSFSVSLADPKASTIQPEMLVRFKNRSYKTRTVVTDINAEEGSAVVECYCERLWYDLIYIKEIKAIRFTGGYAAAVMADLLSGTGWAVGRVDADSGLSFSLEDGTLLAALKSVASVFGLTLVFDDNLKLVHLLASVGRDRGAYFTYEKGISAAVKTVDTTSLVTRLYGKNADGRTIGPANAGVDYIDDFTWTTDIRVATYDFRSGMAPAAMLKYLRAFLAARSQPSVTYEYSLRGLIDRVDEVDRFEVFDQVLVFDNEYGTPVKSSVVNLVIDWVDLRRSKITLGSRKPSLASADDEAAPTGSSSGDRLQFAQIKNSSALTLGVTASQVVSLDFTVTEATQIQVGLSFRANLNGESLPVTLTGYLTLDGDRLSEEIAYTATYAGWVTIGLPILVQGVATGNHTLTLMLKTSAGSATIPISGAALWLASSGVAGGGSNSPNRSLRETLASWWPFKDVFSQVAVTFPTQVNRPLAETVTAALALQPVFTEAVKFWLSPIVTQTGSSFSLTGMVPNSKFVVKVKSTMVDSTQDYLASATGTYVIDIKPEYMLGPGTYTVTISPAQVFTVILT